MAISVRLPPGVEQKLADYCTSEKVTKSEAIKRALEQLLDETPVPLSEDPFFRKFIGSDSRPGDVARHSKRLLRQQNRRK
jgi:predicted DNA-binding protein